MSHTPIAGSGYRGKMQGSSGLIKRVVVSIGPSCSILISKIHVSSGDPVNEILKTADAEGYDAIIVGNHGRRFLPHSYLGSVSSGVLHQSRKPVIMIPPSIGDKVRSN